LVLQGKIKEIMFNIKSVLITDKMPCDLGKVDELIKFLGNCNLPCSDELLNFKFDNLSEEGVKISSGGYMVFSILQLLAKNLFLTNILKIFSLL